MTTITLQLESNVEQTLRESARLRGQTLETYLRQLAEDHARLGADAATPLAPRDNAAGPGGPWSTEWRAWAAGHAVLPALADDRRESLYDDGDEGAS